MTASSLVRPRDHRLVERRALALEAVPVRIHRHRSGMPPSGFGTSAKRLIQMRSPTSRWLSVLWIEPKNAPRSRRRSSSRKRIGDAIQVLVLPAIVARHAPHIGRDRSSLPPQGDGPPRTQDCRSGPEKSRRRCGFLGQRGLGLLDDGLECRRLVDREIGQHLAIDRDAGLREPVDKPAVGEAERDAPRR